MELIYRPENMSRMVEYAGRTCWKSNDRENKSEPTKFISGIVNKAHESVIEHGQIILKLKKKDYSMGTILRAISNPEDNDNASITMIRLVETSAHIYLAGNIRGFKNVVRNTEKENILRDKLLTDIFPQLNSGFFRDFMNQGIMPNVENKDTANAPELTPRKDEAFHIMSDLRDVESAMLKLLSQDEELTEASISKLFTLTIQMRGARWLDTQLIRHKSPVSQESLRYVDGGGFDYLVPVSLRDVEFTTPVKYLGENRKDINTDIVMKKTMEVEILKYIGQNTQFTEMQKHTLNKIDFSTIIGKIIGELDKADYIKREDDTVEYSYHDLMKFIDMSYRQREQLGVRKEDMRNILPLATMSEIVFTRPINQWKHLFKLRMEKHTQFDTRLLITSIYLFIMSSGAKLIGRMFGEELNELILWDEINQSNVNAGWWRSTNE